MSEREPTNSDKNELDIGDMRNFQIVGPVLPAQRSLSLERNNSLSLMGFRSIQNPLPIPKNMLSLDKDHLQPQDRQYQQKQSNHEDFRAPDSPEDDLINFFDLAEIHSEPKKQQKTSDNTKNVLRNFGNAQNHYVLYHKKSRQRIEKNIRQVHEFDSWVRTLKLENFEHFKKAWSKPSPRLFTRVYKEICWEFYTQNAPPYVLSSRIKKQSTQSSHLKHIYRFLEGLADPNSFNYFKKQ